MEFLPVVIGLAFLYLLPSIFAWYRRHSKFAAIVVLNLLLGWTFIGWAVAMVWAFAENRRAEEEAMWQHVDEVLREKARRGEP